MIIYKLTSPSGKSYIGLTKATLRRRFGQHLTLWRKLKKQGVTDYRGHQVTSLLFFAFDKYDPKTWTTEVLFETDDSELLRLAEIEFIAYYSCVGNGYNVLNGGQKGNSGRKLSEETKRKMSEARKKYWQTDDGQAWREELSQNLVGNKLGEGKPTWNAGIKTGPRPQEVRNTISSKLKGKERSEEHKENIRKSKLGHKQSKETVQKRIDKLTGKNYKKKKGAEAP